MAEFQQVGNNGPTIAGSECQMVAASATRVYTIETGLVRALDFDGTDWAQVGNAFVISGLSSSEGKGIAIHDSGDVSITYENNGSEVRRLSFDGTNWTSGNPTSIGGDIKTCCSINTDDVVIFNTTTGELRAWEYDGANFAQVGGSNFYTIGGFPSHVGMTQMAPDRIAFLDDVNEELRMLELNGSSWSPVGNALAVDSFSGQVSLTRFGDSSVIVSYGNTFINLLQIYEFDGADWSKTFEQAQATRAALAVLSDTQIAVRYAPFLITTLEFRTNPAITANQLGNSFPETFNASGLSACKLELNNDSAVVIAKSGFSADSFIAAFSFDGTDWSQEGNKFTSIPDFNTLGVTLLVDNRVAYIDNSVDLKIYDYVDPDWFEGGIPLDLGFAFISNPWIVSLDPQQELIAFVDVSNDSLRTYQFGGVSWSQVGNALNVSPLGTLSMAALSDSKVVIFDSDTKAFRTFNWDGSDWTEEGPEFLVSGINLTGQFSAMAALSSTRIAFQSNSGAFLRVYDYLGNNEWEMKYGNLFMEGITTIVALSATRFATADTGTNTLRMWEIVETSGVVSLFWEELGPNAVQGAS